MAEQMANAGITTNANLSLVELPPGMGRAQPIYGSPHAYVGTVILQSGEAFDFHSHPNQNETIIVTEGVMEGWVDREMSILKPGDVMICPAGVVHACFNDSDAVVRIMVVLDPLIPGTDDDFELIEGYGWEMNPVADQAPWNGLRAA